MMPALLAHVFSSLLAHYFHFLFFFFAIFAVASQDRPISQHFTKSLCIISFTNFLHSFFLFLLVFFLVDNSAALLFSLFFTVFCDFYRTYLLGPSYGKRNEMKQYSMNDTLTCLQGELQQLGKFLLLFSHLLHHTTGTVIFFE